MAQSVFIPILDVDITLTFPDDTTEQFELEAPNAEGQEIYWLEFRPVDVLEDYRGGNMDRQRGYRVYQFFAHFGYRSHNMNLFKLIASSNVALKVPPTFSNTPETDYQEFDCLVNNRRAIKNYLGGLAMNSTDDPTLVPAGSLTLEFKGKEPFDETEMLDAEFALGAVT